MTVTKTITRRGGFTLVELLTVMIIITLLASILLPTVTSAIRTGHTAKSIAAVSSLEKGAINYKQDRKYYPGQEYSNWGGKSGSQVLAACVFGYVDHAANPPYQKADLADPDPTGKYASYKEGNLNELNGRKNALSDMFPRGKDMAIVYYPSHRDTVTASVNNYHYDDNSVHTPGKTVTQFHDLDKNGGIADSRYGASTPHKPGEFVLIAPGVDREYFTSDDVRNY